MPAAVPQPASQDDIMAATLATLAHWDAPADADTWGWPDPDCAPPPELASLAAGELAELLAAEPDRVAEALPAGCLPRDGSGGGAGFADGGELDVLVPGVALAGFADAAHARQAGLSDDELIGVLRGWRRLASWAQARELAAVAELARRRPAPGTPPPAPGEFPSVLSEFIADEVAPALTLTRHKAEEELGLALDLAIRLPGTAAALETGRIDLAKAMVIADGVIVLADQDAAAAEAAVLPAAGGMTTGQLRAAVSRAAQAADPLAARQRRQRAQRKARVEYWAEPAGTATLAGRDLPPAEVLVADKRLCQIAAAWRGQGAVGGMDLLRARAYLALLLGQDIDAPPAELLPPAAAPAPGRSHPGPSHPGQGDPAAPRPSGQQQVPPGLRRPGAGGGLPPLAGSVNITVPLATLLGLSDAPGAAAGYGPLDPDTTRALARAAAGHPATRWHLTVTGPDGQAHGYGRATHAETTADSGGGWTVTVTAEPIAAGRCDHRNAEPGYRPSPQLQRLIRARSGTCSAPGCRRPAARCDLDHTVPYDQDGLTCECNISPLCRHHHRVKQAEGWKLEQTSPGVMTWTTPAGRRYTTLPAQHPT